MILCLSYDFELLIILIAVKILDFSNRSKGFWNNLGCHIPVDIILILNIAWYFDWLKHPVNGVGEIKEKPG